MSDFGSVKTKSIGNCIYFLNLFSKLNWVDRGQSYAQNPKQNKISRLSPSPPQSPVYMWNTVAEKKQGLPIWANAPDSILCGALFVSVCAKQCSREKVRVPHSGEYARQSQAKNEVGLNMPLKGIEGFNCHKMAEVQSESTQVLWGLHIFSNFIWLNNFKSYKPFKPLGVFAQACT